VATAHRVGESEQDYQEDRMGRNKTKDNNLVNLVVDKNTIFGKFDNQIKSRYKL